jgi:pimeloyl-ACP methyl ester carboxylesterase
VTGPPLDATVAGTGEPALALLPGWCCDRSTLEPLAALLRPHHRTITIDWRGFGGSLSPPPGYDLGGTVEDLRQTLTARLPDGAVLVGHSLGGRIALAFAVRHPALVRAVVLLDSVIDEAEDHVTARREELDAPDWRRRLRERFGGLARGPVGGDGAALVERIAGTPREVARSSLAAADAVEAACALASLPVPVLYVGATEPRAEPRRLRHLQANLDYGQVVGSGHFLQLEVPEQVAPMIERFLRLRAPTPPPAARSSRPDDGATVI